MKLPRDVPADRLVRALERFGYRVIRQTGSHIRMIYEASPAHFVSVPRHRALKTGMLHAILKDVAARQSIPVASVIEKL